MSERQDFSRQMSLDCVVEIDHKPLGEKGEDSFAYSFEKPDLHTQAVFDGCGGSGSWEYAEFKNATGALISAQSIAKEFLLWFETVPSAERLNARLVKDSFHSMTNNVLQRLKSSCAPMKVSGSMVRAFPCTASVAFMTGREKGLDVTVLNVGDSRVYFLTPQTGLVQITKDDSAGDPDPMESLIDSAPLSDMLNADRPYEIKMRQLALAYPCAVICASDGVFGYVRSPMDFEFMLLDTLMHSRCFAEFESALKDRIVKVTGDDSTCIMSFYGWGSFENVQNLLKERYEKLAAVVRSLDKAMKEDRLAQEMERIWPSYKQKTVLYEMQGQ